MDGRAAASPGDKPGFLFVQRRQSSTVHPVHSDAMDEGEKENLGLPGQIDAFRVLSEPNAKDVARPAELEASPGVPPVSTIPGLLTVPALRRRRWSLSRCLP